MDKLTVEVLNDRIERKKQRWMGVSWTICGGRSWDMSGIKNHKSARINKAIVHEAEPFSTGTLAFSFFPTQLPLSVYTLNFLSSVSFYDLITTSVLHVSSSFHFSAPAVVYNKLH